MSSNINRVTISGNLTRDAELRGNGGVCALGVAVNDRRKNPQTDEWEDVPNFIDCVIFGSRGEKLQPYLTKGTKVTIAGRLHHSTWERDGERRSKVEVIVEELEFMSRGDGGGQRRQGGGSRQAQASDPYGAPMGDIPAPGVYQPALPTQQAAPATDDIPF